MSEVDGVEAGSEEDPRSWWQRDLLLFSLYKNRHLFALASALLLLLLLGGALNLSLLRVERGLTLFSSSPERWWTGAPLALRVEGRALLADTLIELSTVTASWHRVGGQRLSEGPYLLNE
ncbi:MAG: hypothetical protein VYD19_11520, partial [Myxococcota bacterium]|nr:hypothetical protein [Myxococcota bacterium]